MIQKRTSQSRRVASINTWAVIVGFSVFNVSRHPKQLGFWAGMTIAVGIMVIFVELMRLLEEPK